MRRSGHIVFTALLAGALLAAPLLTGCQTTAPPSATAARSKTHSDGPGRVITEKRGWTVELHATDDRERAFCLARRAAAAPGLVFVAAARDSGFRLTGLPPRGDGDPAQITALFDDGERVPFQAHALDDRALAVAFPTADYEDALYPFARSRTVEFHSGGGALASFSLSGSSWAINATDECRRMHTGS
ncbi:MAG TPA: hypothetical protein VGE72_03495 [Azospirillum sp.]